MVPGAGKLCAGLTPLHQHDAQLKSCLQPKQRPMSAQRMPIMGSFLQAHALPEIESAGMQQHHPGGLPCGRSRAREDGYRPKSRVQGKERNSLNRRMTVEEQASKPQNRQRPGAKRQQAGSTHECSGEVVVALHVARQLCSIAAKLPKTARCRLGKGKWGMLQQPQGVPAIGGVSWTLGCARFVSLETDHELMVRSRGNMTLSMTMKPEGVRG